jgi:hypothetical protein
LSLFALNLGATLACQGDLLPLARVDSVTLSCLSRQASERIILYQNSVWILIGMDEVMDEIMGIKNEYVSILKFKKV